MGFKRGSLILKFEGEFDGLEIKMKRLPIGDLMAVSSLADIGKELTQDTFSEPLDKLLGTLASNVISWNLEDENDNPVEIVKGSPSHVENMEGDEIYVPSTGMYSLDIELILKIIDVWVTTAAGVTAEMGKASMNGSKHNSTPHEEFQLMDAISLSQQSLGTQNSSINSSDAIPVTH